MATTEASITMLLEGHYTTLSMHLHLCKTIGQVHRAITKVLRLDGSIGIRRETPKSTRMTDEFLSIPLPSFDHRSLSSHLTYNLLSWKTIQWWDPRGNHRVLQSSMMTPPKCSVVLAWTQRRTCGPNNNKVMMTHPPTQYIIPYTGDQRHHSNSSLSIYWQWLDGLTSKVALGNSESNPQSTIFLDTYSYHLQHNMQTAT
jgi:hypothetical protein